MSTSSHVIGKEFSVGLTTALVDLLKPSSEMPVRRLCGQHPPDLCSPKISQLKRNSLTDLYSIDTSETKTSFLEEWLVRLLG